MTAIVVPFVASNFKKNWKSSFSFTAHIASQLDGAEDGKTDGLGDTDGTVGRFKDGATVG